MPREKSLEVEVQFGHSLGMLLANIQCDSCAIAQFGSNGHSRFKDIVQPKKRGVKSDTIQFVLTSYTIADVFFEHL